MRNAQTRPGIDGAASDDDTGLMTPAVAVSACIVNARSTDAQHVRAASQMADSRAAMESMRPVGAIECFFFYSCMSRRVRRRPRSARACFGGPSFHFFLVAPPRQHQLELGI